MSSSLTTQSEPTRLSLQGQIPETSSGLRLDQVAAEMFPEYSRSKIQDWIKSGELTLDGRKCKAKLKVFGGELVLINAESQVEGDWLPEAMDLNIVFEDDDLLVINKPAGLVVHPAAGNWSGTLLNGLLHHCPKQIELPRAGIVHRLDKDTSGLMVVAKTLTSQTSLVNQLQERSVSRVYRALVHGELPCVLPSALKSQKKGKSKVTHAHASSCDLETVFDGSIEADIGRHPTARTRMAVVKSGGKFARTHYRSIETFEGYTHVELKLDSGRTHQIRVHMAHLGFPLVGDPVYGKKIPAAKTRVNEVLQALENFERQALHAIQLGLIHPQTNKYCEWRIDMAQDMSDLFSLLSI